MYFHSILSDHKRTCVHSRAGIKALKKGGILMSDPAGKAFPKICTRCHQPAGTNPECTVCRGIDTSKFHAGKASNEPEYDESGRS